MRLIPFALTLLALWPAPVSAQMHVTSDAEKVYIGTAGEFMPRPATYLPNSTVLQAGANVVLPGGVTNRGAIEVEAGATLTIPAGARPEVGTLVVHVGGRLVIDAPCGQQVDYTIRNLPINTTQPNQPGYDPFQWTTGIVVFGTLDATGCVMPETFVPLGGSVGAGTTVMPVQVPAGWQVNDTVFLPDTTQQSYADYAAYHPGREESAVRIASIAVDRSSLTLTKPLDFAHPLIPCVRVETGIAADACADGIAVLPRIANLSRSIVIHSEDPTGTPGHVAVVGHDAEFHISGVEFRDVGRTGNGPLNATAIDLTSIGSNQPGRYAFHAHHSKGVGSFIERSSLHGLSRKWALAIHGTSDTRVERNVCVGPEGACFVTEDGNEVRNTFEKNFAARAVSDKQYIPSPAVHFTGQNRPGSEGACGWWRGVMNRFIANEAWGCNIGHSIFYVPVKHDYPSVPGGPHDAVLGFRESPIEWRDNLAVASLTNGMEFWRVESFPIVRQIVAYGSVAQFIVGPITDQVGIHLVDSLIVNEPNAYTTSASIPKPYVEHLLIEGSIFAGALYGLGGGGGRLDVTIRNSVIDTLWVGLDFSGGVPDGTMTLENLRFPNTGWPIVYGPVNWEPGIPSGDLTGCQHKVINYNGTGLNYCLSNPATEPPPDPPVDGGWSDWSAWSDWTPINMTTEQRTRTRTCTNPAPANGGAPCSGPDTEVEQRPIVPPDPFPGSVNSRVCVPGGPCYEGAIPRVP